MNRRAQIALTDVEVQELLEAQRTVICASHGPSGWPHLMPLWYVVRDGQVWSWTYGKSQKVRNLERDDRATLQVEAGSAYNELRGMMIETNAVIHRDTMAVAEVGLELLGRYAPGGTAGPEAAAAIAAQAAKRVALQFVPRRMASWDHRKLGARS